MRIERLTNAQYRQRSAVRAFLLTATLTEIVKELELGDAFRRECVQELLDERRAAMWPRDTFSRLVSELHFAAANRQECHEDVDAFHAPSECHRDVSRWQDERRDGILERYHVSADDVDTELRLRLSPRAAYELGSWMFQ